MSVLPSRVASPPLILHPVHFTVPGACCTILQLCSGKINLFTQLARPVCLHSNGLIVTYKEWWSQVKVSSCDGVWWAAPHGQVFQNFRQELAHFVVMSHRGPFVVNIFVWFAE